MTISVNNLLNRSFVISISSDRYQKFCQVFTQHKLTPLPKLFNGFNLANGIYRDAGLIKTSNIYNCLASHVAIVKMAQSLDWPFICIFEDDAWPCNNAIDKLDKHLSNLPDEICLLKLGHLGSLKGVEKYNEMLSYIKTYGSHAYIVFNRYYGTFAKLANKDLHIDRLAMNPKDGQLVLATSEMLFMQNDYGLNDTIHDNSMYNKMLKQQGWLKDFDI